MLQDGGPGLTRYPGLWGWRQACATFLRGEIFRLRYGVMDGATWNTIPLYDLTKNG